MKSLMPFVTVFAFLFSSCTTTPNSSELTSLAIPTSSVTPVPSPSTTSTPEPTTTATAIESLAPTQGANLSADEMSIVVSSAENNLADRFKLAKNLANTYSISRPDGSPVKNIVLEADGKFHVTQADGTEIAIDPLTVRMPDANTIYAELNKIDLTTGDTVSEISIDLTKWNAGDNDPIITDDSLPMYESWIISQLEKTGRLDTMFAGSDPTMKWQIVTNIFAPRTSSDGQATIDELLPTGTKTSKPISIDAQQSLESIPTRSYPSFVKNASHPGTSVIPVFIENANPASSEDKYAVFPGIVDTPQVSAPQSDSSSLAFVLKPPSVDVGYQEYLTIVSKIDSEATVDGLINNGTVLKMFKGDADTNAAARNSVLQNGIAKGNFTNSSKYFWPLSGWIGRTK